MTTLRIPVYKKRVLYEAIKALRDVNKRVPVTPPGTGTKSEFDYTEEVTAEVTIDLGDLYHMVHKAANSKGGKCVDGALTVRVTDRRKV